mmetsp:Transcript_89099/g.186188  ORF Transcript_89099/g.186188 Transcript_89099/m.186188 type:complete len:302 (-) Transcript_89099:652-1557(-)
MTVSSSLLLNCSMNSSSLSLKSAEVSTMPSHHFSCTSLVSNEMVSNASNNDFRFSSLSSVVLVRFRFLFRSVVGLWPPFKTASATGTFVEAETSAACNSAKFRQTGAPMLAEESKESWDSLVPSAVLAMMGGRAAVVAAAESSTRFSAPSRSRAGPPSSAGADATIAARSGSDEARSMSGDFVDVLTASRSANLTVALFEGKLGRRKPSVSEIWPWSEVLAAVEGDETAPFPGTLDATSGFKELAPFAAVARGPVPASFLPSCCLPLAGGLNSPCVGLEAGGVAAVCPSSLVVPVGVGLTS